MLPLLSGASLAFSSACTDGLSPGRDLEEPLLLSFEPNLDF